MLHCGIVFLILDSIWKNSHCVHSMQYEVAILNIHTVFSEDLNLVQHQMATVSACTVEWAESEVTIGQNQRISIQCLNQRRVSPAFTPANQAQLTVTMALITPPLTNQKSKIMCLCYTINSLRDWCTDDKLQDNNIH